MQHDNKNFILAIVLSMAIIFGWQYFYALPTQKKLEQQTQQSQQTQVTNGASPAKRRYAVRLAGSGRSRHSSRSTATPARTTEISAAGDRASVMAAASPARVA